MGRALIFENAVRIVSIAACLIGPLACNAIMDLGRFDERVTSSDGGDAATLDGVSLGSDAGDDGGGDPSGDKNLVLVLQRMAPHPTQLFEFRIVDGANRIQTHGILDPLGEQDVTIHVPMSVMQVGGPYRLDFYADMNNSRSYDGIGSGTANDHAWRIPLEPSTRHGRTVEIKGNDMVVTFLHDTVFTDINTTVDGTAAIPADTGLAATVKFPTLPASYLGVPIEVRVANKDTGRTVALFRYPQAKAPPFDMVVPGVVEGNVSYAITVYIDADGNGEYDNPSTGGPDKGWCLERTADLTAGLVFEFDPSLAGAGTCDVGAP